jgi:hypothetical protein
MLLNDKKKNKSGGDVKANLISGRGKLILLIVFCLLAGSISFYAAKSSFSGKQKISLSANSIKKPKNIHKPSKERRTSVGITHEEYLRIYNFKLYLDSIASTPSGRITFDSIITARPGLIDSILIIEHIYLSQTKE